MPSQQSRVARRCAAAVVALVSLSTAGWADEPAAYADLCERAIRHGAEVGGVPVQVLHAVALTETGRWQQGRLRPWPWAANREGKGHWFASRDEALAFARRSLAEGRRSFDIGCFQINYHWHGHQFPTLEAMADPTAGAAYAARFLRELYEEFGSWSAAAGAYHSRTPEFAQRYRARFDQILAGLDNRLADGPAVASPAAPARVAAATGGRQVRGPRIITIRPAQPGEEPAPVEQEATSDRLVIVRSPTREAAPGPFEVSSIAPAP